MKTLVSHRLILRPFRDEDISFLCSLLGDKDRTKLLFRGKIMNQNEVEDFAREHFTSEDLSFGLGILTLKNQHQRPIGFAGVIPTTCLGNKDFEFGFVLEKSAEGKGYATEIGRIQMQYAFENLALERILALAHPKNTASVHVLNNKLMMKVISKLEKNEQRGPRLVFSRLQSDGLPDIA